MTASESASQFVGDIPSHYDAGLGPNIFVDFARNLAHRVGALGPSRVLELAAGTGIATQQLRQALPDAQITATDLNAPMLEVARAKLSGVGGVEFAVADAMQLSFPDASFEAVCCQFGVMFFPGKQASFREVLRVLRPGGHYLFNAWGTHGENPFARIAQEVSLTFFPSNPPGFYRVPFSYADPEAAKADLRAAGFGAVQHEAVELLKRVADIEAFARGLVFGNPLIDEIKSRGGVDPEQVVAAIEQRFRKLFGAEPVMPLKAHVYAARKP